MTSWPDHLPSGNRKESGAILRARAARTIWTADAHRGDGKRFVVRSKSPDLPFAMVQT